MMDCAAAGRSHFFKWRKLWTPHNGSFKIITWAPEFRWANNRFMCVIARASSSSPANGQFFHIIACVLADIASGPAQCPKCWQRFSFLSAAVNISRAQLPLTFTPCVHACELIRERACFAAFLARDCAKDNRSFFGSTVTPKWSTLHKSK